MIGTPVYVRFVLVGPDGEAVRTDGLRRELLGGLLAEFARNHGVMAEAPDTSRGPLARVVGPSHDFFTVTMPTEDPEEAVSECRELVWTAAATRGVRIRHVDVTHNAGSFLRAP